MFQLPRRHFDVHTRYENAGLLNLVDVSHTNLLQASGKPTSLFRIQEIYEEQQRGVGKSRALPGNLVVSVGACYCTYSCKDLKM